MDLSGVRLRTASIAIGFWLTVAVCLASFVYVGLTWDRPNRALLSVVFVIALAAAFVVRAVPAERIVHGRRAGRAAAQHRQAVRP
jgi:hypothetical protein